VKTWLTISATGLLTPLGFGPQLWEMLRAGITCSPQGRISNELLRRHGAAFGVPDPEPSMDRAVRFALHAATEALATAQLNAPPHPPSIGLYVGTSKGPIGSWIEACAALREGRPLDCAAAELLAAGPGAIASTLSARLNLHGPVHTSVAACASGLFALHRAAQAIAAGECARALVVAADASLHPLFEASFARLGVLAKLDAAGQRPCRPFDPAATGFFLSEGAAALLLEPAPEDPAGVQLESSWIGADGTHLLAVDPRTQALRHGLRHVAAPPVAFVHAHATGTAHDQYELQAIRSVLGAGPPVFSTKGLLGHTLGAAGLISLVISVRAHQNRRIPDGRPLPPQACSITIAQGFGGHIGMAALRG